MNTKQLAKHYGSLNVVERLRLIHDAERRGDTSEKRQLVDSTTTSYTINDFGKLEEELKNLVMLHHIELLEVAAEFWYAQTNAAWVLAESKEVVESDGTAENAPRLIDDVRYQTCFVKCKETQYVIERDGWNLFIQQSGFDESRLWRAPRTWLLDYMNEHAKAWPDVENARRWLLDFVGAEESEIPSTLKTPESVAKGWHRIVELITADDFIKEHGIRQ